MIIRTVEPIQRIRDKQPRPTKEELEARMRWTLEQFKKEKNNEIR